MTKMNNSVVKVGGPVTVSINTCSVLAYRHKSVIVIEMVGL